MHMHTKWRKTIPALLLAASLTVSAAPLAASARQELASAAQSQGYSAKPMKLAGTVRAELKSAFVERGADGSTIGVVIWLQNDGAKVTRVPDYELRIVTGDGVSYTLTPSASNPRAIQAKGKAELGYMLNVERTDGLEPEKLAWVSVDEYVYPRKETTLLTMNIAGKVWQNADPDGGSAGAVKWGQPFRLDMFSPNVTYTPVSMQKQATAQGGIVTVVTVKATNAGKEKAYLPDIAVSGSDGSKLYAGERAGGTTATLAAGESRNIRFAIPTAAGVNLREFVVTTPERFAAAGGSALVFHVGHVRIGLPDNGFSLAGLSEYAYGTPIALDPLNELVDKDVRVSLVELHMHDNQGDGYKTAIAKFKLQNTGKEPAPLPAFQADLTSAEGYTYSGVRQNTVAQQLMPGLSHIVSYSFNVPKTENAEKYALRLLEGGTTESPYSSPIADAVAVKVQSEAADSDVWDLYPFQVKMKYWWLSAVYETVPNISYSYKLKLNLDIQGTDDVVVDANFSKLKFEIVDAFGKMLGSETVPLAGTGRLVSGYQTINFTNIRTEQQEYPLSIQVFEVIDTPNGEAKRLIKTFDQI
ncbi:hypothetical protein GE107_20785 [Cohnella sp. CFH 77786]|uniref:hypothetical protein n=1 Tax=Cohnella sp. CFH 77786 TaxID=2662265 RepID=UPI001C610F77|nr:hypothetical protein [Cohnella sp. CFH 77786]MBW5448485.1 hypothetical protein [Cohnella sp. CFH 77786]